jgi:hypothetical protein
MNLAARCGSAATGASTRQDKKGKPARAAIGINDLAAAAGARGRCMLRKALAPVSDHCRQEQSGDMT